MPKKKRTYNTLGRRILAMLEIGGPRKRTVLQGIAGSEKRLRPVLQRLMDAGLIVIQRKRTADRGGQHYALARQR